MKSRSRTAAVITISAITAWSASVLLPAQSSQQPRAASSVLLELFTSEGCSSCPPADSLLGALDGKTTENGQLLVALSEHVTYWNHQGWSDPYSSDVFTGRQSGYSRRFSLGGELYTPQLVVNGDKQMVGSDRSAVAAALAAQPRSAAVPLRIKSVTEMPGHLDLVYSAPLNSSQKSAELFAAIADDTDVSQVGGGENNGRRLVHVSVARTLVQLGRLKASSADRHVSIPIPPAGLSAGPQHLVLFAQTAGLGPVLGVDTKALPRPEGEKNGRESTSVDHESRPNLLPSLRQVSTQ